MLNFDDLDKDATSVPGAGGLTYEQSQYLDFTWSVILTLEGAKPYAYQDMRDADDQVTTGVGFKIWEKWGQSAFGAAISIGLFLSCAANRTEAEATPSLSELLEDRSVQVRVCNDAVATAAMCKEIALALTQNKVTAITPAVVVPDVDDDRMASLGRDCPPTGADMKDDPYLPFELEYDGWQAVPRGPFEVLKIAPHYPKWREFNIVSSAGYDYKNQRLSTGQPLSWKAYYMVPARLACPPILIDALFHRGREQASRQKVSDAVVVWKGRVLIVNAQEEPTASNRYYVSVSLIPDDPRVTGQSGGAGRIQLLSFIAQ